MSGRSVVVLGRRVATGEPGPVEVVTLNRVEPGLDNHLSGRVLPGHSRRIHPHPCPACSVLLT